MSTLHSPASILAMSEAKHNTSVKLAVLYYEERVLGINRPPAEITALRNRIKAGVSVIYPDGRKYAEADKAVKTLYSKR